MNKENVKTGLDVALMLSALALIWWSSNGWVVLGLVVITNIFTRNTVHPIEEKLTKTTSELETLRAINEEMQKKIDLICNTLERD